MTPIYEKPPKSKSAPTGPAQIQTNWQIRLRQVDVKSEHFERRVAGLETERDSIEKKYEAMLEQYSAAKAELDDMHKQLEDL